MKIKPYETDSFIGSLNPFKNLILLYGPDEGLIQNRSNRLINSFIDNTNETDSVKTIGYKNFDKLSLVDSQKSQSLFSKKQVIKIVEVSDNIILKLDEIIDTDKNTLFIIQAGELTPKSKLRKYFEESEKCLIIPCYKIDSVQLKKIIINFTNEKNIALDRECVDYLIGNLGGNYAIIISELEKLLLINKKTISYNDLKNLIAPKERGAYEDLVFNCLSGKKELFGKEFESSIQDLNSANRLLANTKNLLLIFIKSIKSLKNNELQKVLTMHMPAYMFRKKQTFSILVKNNTEENILKCLNIISEIELKTRKTQSLYKIILFRGMLNISQSIKF